VAFLSRIPIDAGPSEVEDDGVPSLGGGQADVQEATGEQLKFCVAVLNRALHAGPSDKDAKLGQLQPFIAVFPQECIGQLAYFGPT
jgi:hypothetical protein